VDLEIRGDDQCLLQVVVGDLPLALLVHLARIVPVVGVEHLRLRPLPDAGALEGGVVVLGPGDLRLQDDLAEAGTARGETPRK
jgi:hypothetical protein